MSGGFRPTHYKFRAKSVRIFSKAHRQLENEKLGSPSRGGTPELGFSKSKQKLPCLVSNRFGGSGIKNEMLADWIEIERKT